MSVSFIRPRTPPFVVNYILSTPIGISISMGIFMVTKTYVTMLKGCRIQGGFTVHFIKPHIYQQKEAV